MVEYSQTNWEHKHVVIDNHFPTFHVQRIVVVEVRCLKESFGKLVEAFQNKCKDSKEDIFCFVLPINKVFDMKGIDFFDIAIKEWKQYHSKNLMKRLHRLILFVRIFGIHNSINIVLKHQHHAWLTVLNQLNDSEIHCIISILIVEILVDDGDDVLVICLNNLLDFVHFGQPQDSFLVQQDEKLRCHFRLYCAQEHQVLDVFFVRVIWLRVQHKLLLHQKSLQNIVVCVKLNVKTFKLWCLELADFIVRNCVWSSQFVLENVQWKHVEKYVGDFSWEIYQFNSISKNCIKNFFTPLLFSLSILSCAHE